MRLLDDDCAGIAANPADSAPDRLFQPSFSAPREERLRWHKNLFKRFFSDQKFLVMHWWPAESRRVGFSVPLVVAIAGASQSDSGGVDLQWQRGFQGWSSQGRRHDVAYTVSRLGDATSGALLVGGTYLVSKLSGNERLQRASSLSAEALLSVALYTSALKSITRRTRPRAGGTGAFFVDDTAAGQSPNSFPSGHTTGAFTIATVFAAEFRDRPWVRWTAYGTASLIALSRVALGAHFPTDVLAGAVLGNSIGRMVVYRSGVSDGRRDRWTRRIGPLFDAENGGFGLAYRHTW